MSPQVKSSVQFESRRSGLQREEARDSWAGVVLPDPQLRLLCLDTGRLPARELEREEQELAGLTCVSTRDQVEKKIHIKKFLDLPHFEVS